MRRSNPRTSWLTALLLLATWLALPGVAVALASPAGWALALLLVVWLVNVYNFMDGMDGFAGGMAVIGFGTLAILGARAGDAAFAGANAVVVAAASASSVCAAPSWSQRSPWPWWP